MNKIYSRIFLATLSVILVNACKTGTELSTDEPNTEAPLTMVFENMVGDQNVEKSLLKYSNQASNPYSISLLKYYISNITLHRKTGEDVKLDKYELIDAFDAASTNVNLGLLKTGEYDSLTFYLGIDQNRNHTGVQDGDLDVSKGMFWTWNTGYIFFKHEGQFKDSTNQNRSLVFHYGSDMAFAKIKIPIMLNLNGEKSMHIKFDLNKAYSMPNVIDFHVDNNRQSTSSNDAAWIAKMKSNFANAFSFVKVE